MIRPKLDVILDVLLERGLIGSETQIDVTYEDSSISLSGLDAKTSWLGLSKKPDKRPETTE